MIPYESCRYSHFSCHTRAVVNRASSFNSCPSLCGVLRYLPAKGLVASLYVSRGQMVFLNDGERREIRFVYTTLPFDIDVIHTSEQVQNIIYGSINTFLSFLFFVQHMTTKIFSIIFHVFSLKCEQWSPVFILYSLVQLLRCNHHVHSL